MKRVLTILAILLLPLSVWAMTPVSDSDLSNVTGQAGVSINADLTMDITIGTMAWGDGDGISDYWRNATLGFDYTDGGFVGMDDFNLNDLRIRARAETTDGYNGYSTFKLKPITIDVATDTSAVDPLYDGVTFVRFGLGALQISLQSMSFNVGTGAYVPAGSAVAITDIMGSVNLGDIEVYINPLAYVDIYSHAGQGVNFTMNVIIDRFELGYLSWGDSDGLDAQYSLVGVEFMDDDTTAGYVGLNGLTLGDATHYGISITGTAAIDVLTTQQGIYALLPFSLECLYAEVGLGLTAPTPAAMGARLAAIYGYFLDPAHLGGYTNGAFTSGPVPTVTAVHISFPGGMNVNIGSIRSQVCVSNLPTLAAGANTGVMGDIYLESLGIAIQDGSWVDIWAH